MIGTVPVYQLPRSKMDFASITGLAYLPIRGGAHLDVTDNSLRQAGLAQSGKK
jgi:hypothetical protein